LEEEEMQAMTQSLDLLIRSGTHPNVIQLIGLCEDKVPHSQILDSGRRFFQKNKNKKTKK
jgi:hypothetical protein